VAKKIIFITIILFGLIYLIVSAPAISGVVQDGDKTYIVDRHGERWDVTQAMSIGFEPRRFQHGIGRNAFTPLDDSSLSEDTSRARRNQRVIGVSDGKDANAYSVRKLYYHETANSFLGYAPITAAY
jgi:hypothetical protein